MCIKRVGVYAEGRFVVERSASALLCGGLRQ